MMGSAKVAVCYCVHDDAYYLAESICSYSGAGGVVAFVSRPPWSGAAGGLELAHRQGARTWLLERGCTHALIPDGDEVIEPALLAALLQIAVGELAERVY